jgi:hypothetical protein
MTEHTQRAPNLMNMIIIIGGVLGFIIAILLFLLVVAILYLCKLIRSRVSKTTNIPKRYGIKQQLLVYNLLKLYNFILNNIILHCSSRSSRLNLTDMPVSRNVSYVTTTLADRPTTRDPQSVTVTYPRKTGAATEYSSIGPTYATVHLRRHQPIAMSGVSILESQRGTSFQKNIWERRCQQLDVMMVVAYKM